MVLTNEGNPRDGDIIVPRVINPQRAQHFPAAPMIAIRHALPPYEDLLILHTGVVYIVLMLSLSLFVPIATCLVTNEAVRKSNDLIALALAAALLFAGASIDLLCWCSNQPMRTLLVTTLAMMLAGVHCAIVVALVTSKSIRRLSMIAESSPPIL